MIHCLMWMSEHARAAARQLWSVVIRERDRWVLWSAVGFGFGIGVYFALPFEPPLWCGPALTAAMLMTVLWPGRCEPYVTVAAGAIAIVAAGFAVAQVRTALVDTQLLKRRVGPALVTGQVQRFEPQIGSARVVIANVAVEGLTPAETPKQVRMSLRGQQPAMKTGDIVRIRGVLIPLPAPSTPSGFDFQRQSFYQGLGAVGFAYGRATVVSEATGREGVGAAIARLRQRIGERVQDQLDGDTGAIAVALMTGERSEISKSVMTSIRDSGLAHLLAVSGLNVGLAAGVLFTASRALLALVPAIALRFPIKKMAALAAIAGAAAYVALSGASIPAQRALLMVGLVMLAIILDRRGLSMRSVTWAAIIILCLSPESLLTVSFQLSFAAVVALIAVYEAVRDRRQRSRHGPPSVPWRIALYLGGVALTTLVAGAATAPFAAFHFNQFTWYGLAANLVAVPITALWIMPWAVAVFILMPIGLEAFALKPMGLGVDLVIRVASAVSSWPGAVSSVPATPTWSIVLVTLGGLWLCLWRTTWRYFGIAVVVLGLSGAVIVRPPDLLISGEGTLVAVRREDRSLTFSTLRADRFSREAWLRQFAGNEDVSPWPHQGFSDDGTIGCDSLGCTVQLADHVVAVTRRPEAVAEDCQNANIMLSLVPVGKACHAPRVVIDRFDLWRNGAHAIWLNGWLGNRPIRVKSVNGQRGNRPWTVRSHSQGDG
ncbi:MAG: ComEC/Rec2 family competence protein [Hyphomicrobium sp.]